MTDDLPEVRKGHPFVMYDMLKDTENGLKATARIANELDIDFPRKPVFFTGNGTAYHAALLGSGITGQCGGKINVVQAFELERFWNPEGSIVAFSHTGKTKSTVDAILKHHDNNFTVGVSHYDNTPLARACERSIVIGNSPDLSLCNTKAFFDNALFASMLSSRISGEPFDEKSAIDHIGAIPNQIEKTVIKMAGDLKYIRKIYVLGAGPDFVFARETAQKIREATHIFTEGTELEEFNHGCTAVMDSETLLIMADNQHVDDRVRDIVRGSQFVGTKTIVLNGDGDFSIHFRTTDDVRVNVMINVLVVYYLAYYLAVTMNVNPDLLRFDEINYRKYDDIIFPPGTH